jgi:hypothetical protein
MSTITMTQAQFEILTAGFAALNQAAVGSPIGVEEAAAASQVLIEIRNQIEEAKKFRIFNASGHPIAQDGVEIVGSVEVPNADFADPASVEALAQTIAEAAAPFAKEGIAIAFPGSSTLAMQVVAKIHGLTGSFPRTAWSARNTDGKFLWSEAQQTDLQTMRIAQREGDRV